MPIHDSRQKQQHQQHDSNNHSKSNQVNSSSSSSCRSLNSKSNNNNNNINISGVGDNRKAASIGGDSGQRVETNSKSSLISTNRLANDGSSASAMSNLSPNYYIDDDHIDDQETINVGNLIIDLESDLEKEKIENEQQANAKPSTCSTTSTTTTTPSKISSNAAPSSSSNHSSSSATSSASSTASAPAFSTKGNKASSSTASIGSIGPSSGKINQKSSGKNSTNNAINIDNNNIVHNSNNAINSSNNNGHSASSRAVFKSSSDERGELKMRITRETMPGKSEHKIVTSPNQKSPTSSSNSGLGNANVSSAFASTYDEAHMQKSPPSKPSQSSSISSTRDCGTCTSIGTITEPECLGPCEPGTSVTLEGIVWQETEGGILVVNVTWRGKTYVGALLDCTKHDWAPPRLCDSPASDIDSKTNKGVRPKRIVTRSNGIGLDEKNLLQTTGKLRNGKGRRILAPSDLGSCSKRQRDSEKPSENVTSQPEASGAANVSSNSISENSSSAPMNIDIAPNDSTPTSNMASEKGGPNSPMLIGCNEPNCSKKYRNMNGLLYHQAHAHGNDNDSSNTTQENNCSPSIKSKNVSKDDQSEDASNPMEIEDQPSPVIETKPEQDVQKPQLHPDIKPEHSPNSQPSRKDPAPETTMSINLPLDQDIRPPVVKNTDPGRRNSSNSGHHPSDFGRKSPNATKHQVDHGHPSSSHSSSLKHGTSGGSKQPPPPPMPPTTEEGMKPSGTSTGPPPAPHQANCYFNPAFLANNFNPYLAPYFPRMPLPPMYDGLAPAASNAFLSRFMSNVRPPPPPNSDSPSRLLSPSIPKMPPFPPFKMEPGMPIPTSQMGNPIGLSAISPMTHPPPPPLAGGSPHLRMPSQGDHPLLPPTSQAPMPPPPNMNPLLGLPGPMNPMGPMGPMGGPQVPSLVDDTLAKQMSRRFN